MNKRELAAQVSKQTGVTNKLALQAIDAIFQTIQVNLEKNEPTVIQGFGSFSVISRAERNGMNPSTKQPMLIPAHRVVKFLASKKIEIK